MSARDNPKINLALALILLGSSSAVGIYRAQRGAEVFSQPFFEPAAPVMVVDATDEDEESVEHAETEAEALDARAALPAQPEQASKLDFDVARLASAISTSVNAGRALTKAELKQIRALFATPIGPETPAPYGKARSLILTVLLDASGARVPDEILPSIPTLLAALKDDSSEQAQALNSVLRKAQEQQALLDKAEKLVSSASPSISKLEAALKSFQSVLDADKSEPRALRGLEQVEFKYLARAQKEAIDLDFADAQTSLDAADAIREQSSAVDQARTELFSEMARAEAALLAELESSLDNKRFSDASDTLARLERFLPEARTNALSARIKNAELFGGYARGEAFADAIGAAGVSGPQMRVLPIDNYVMGSPQNEAERQSNEGPQREIAISRGLALSQGEISVGQFALFVASSGYQTEAEREGWSALYNEKTGRIAKGKGITWRQNYRGRKAQDNLPVVHISHNDARAYAAWLAKSTGSSYRLPTEAEFEFGLRAGTTNPYWWSTQNQVAVENLTGELDESSTGRRWDKFVAGYSDSSWGPAPIRSYKSNRFGLMDMAGNVSEWVEDCWHDSYVRAPETAQAWVNPGCALRVVRGGSWGSSPQEARSAFRQPILAGSRGPRIGFRVARDL